MPTVLGLTNDPKTHTTASANTALSANASGQLTKPSSSSSNSGSSKMGGPKKGTISSRNHAAALEIETLLWRAMCDSPAAAKEYIADDCVMLNPLFNNGSDEPVTKDSEPSLEQLLKGAKPWSSFHMHDGVKVVEIDLMAVALVYKVTLYRHDGKKRDVQPVDATVSSSWRQIAGGDWKLVAQHVAYADDYDDDEDEEQ